MRQAFLVSIILVLGVPSTAAAGPLEEHDYVLNCAGCHGLDGSGSRHVPSLHGMREIADAPGARAYWVRVPGAAQAPLSDARLAALMSWLVERFTGAPPRPPYTPDEVARLRRSPLRDPLGTRSTLEK